MIWRSQSQSFLLFLTLVPQPERRCFGSRSHTFARETKKEGCWGNHDLLGCVGHWVWCPELCQKLISARKLMAPVLLGAASCRFLQGPTEQALRKESVTEDRRRRRESWQPRGPLQFWLSRHMSSSEDFIFPRIVSLKKTVFCLMSEQFRLSNQMQLPDQPEGWLTGAEWAECSVMKWSWLRTQWYVFQNPYVYTHTHTLLTCTARDPWPVCLWV